MNGTRSSAPWPAAAEPLLSARDRAVIEASGYGRHAQPGSRPALVVVDATYAFCGDRREPVLSSIERFRNSCGEAAWDAIEVIARLVDRARASGLPIIYTRGFPLETNIGQGAWAAKNRRAEEDVSAHHEIVAPLAPGPDDVVLMKAKPSAFFGTALAGVLVDRAVDSLVVCGGSTSGCVRATVVDAFSFNYPVTVVADGCFDRLELAHAATLLDLQLKYADVVDGAAALRLLCPDSSPTPS